jgi:hypothetical protein
MSGHWPWSLIHHHSFIEREIEMSAPVGEVVRRRGIVAHFPLGVPHSALQILQSSPWDALLILLALGHAALVLSFPYAPIIALGLWWNSNTIAHYFLHRPFFRVRALNVAFSMFLSVLLGIPQTLWRERHLAHHAGKDWRFRLSQPLAAEMLLILGLWSFLLGWNPGFFLATYLPAYAAGLFLCWLHGFYEHARGTTSHYGTIYNFLFLNDGYHIEHHAHPAEHWTKLPRLASPESSASRWPAILRWLESKNGLRIISPLSSALPISCLESLERLVLRSPWLQRFVLTRHEAAFRRLLPRLTRIGQVAIVGGGLFPRSLLVLECLLPQARFTVIDQSAANLQEAKKWVSSAARFVHQAYTPGLVDGMDLVVIPLSFMGDRDAIYRQPPAPAIVIHDWVWRRRGISTIVSFLLLKRLNLVLS